MIHVLLAGIGFGVGSYLVIRGWFPPPRSLTGAFEELDGTRPVLDPRADVDLARIAHLRRRLGTWVVATLESFGLDLGGVRRDLRIIGGSLERHAADKILAAVVFLALPLAAAALATAGGTSISSGWTAATSAVLGVVGFVVPDLTLRTEAERRRRDFRTLLAAYLDLAAIVAAGGGGVETALYDAADVGDNWAFAEIRRTLAACRLTNETPWTALHRLGADLGVVELRDLAATTGLAGEQGARLREALTAKADALRNHQRHELEEEANASTERMHVPVALLLFSFLGLILYPALTIVLSGP